MERMGMLFNINRSIRAGWNMNFVNHIPLFGQRSNIKLMWLYYLLCHVAKYLQLAKGDLSPHAEFILPLTITTLSYISKMNIYIHGFKLWWLHDNHSWFAVRIHNEECFSFQHMAEKSSNLIKLYLTAWCILVSAYPAEMFKGHRKIQL